MMNLNSSVHLGIFICVFVGCASAWTQYGDHLLLVNQTVGNHGDAEMQCSALGGLVVSPLWGSIQTAVIEAAIASYPVKVFWTGLKRENHDTWVSAFYHTSMHALLWGLGYSTADPGDCLAMEVLPTGITYHVEDCTASLSTICHNLTGNHFKEIATEHYFPHNTNFTTKLLNNENECSGLCLGDKGCTGYSWSSLTGECTTFSSLPVSNASDYTINSVDVNATMCCTAEGTVITDCCMFNDTAWEPDCITPYGPNSENFTQCLSLASDVMLPHRTFGVLERSGCLVLEDPANGTIYGQPDTTVYSSFYAGLLDCGFDFKQATSVNYTCGADYRWSETPYCKHEAERCPPGWVQYGYSCYLVDLSSESVEWDDQMAACQQHNAFPLYVTGRQEGHFIDRLLTFHANTTFWTGMTNREGHFRFAHSYALAQHFRWDGREPDDKGCVNLVRTVNGLDLGIFYNNITSCNTTLPYICKMGSSIVGGVCEAHAACRGFATCNNYYGLCLCYAKSHRQMVGAPGNNMTYCSPRWKGNKDYLVLETGISVPWSVAVSLCKEHGGSLYSPVTEDLQQMGLHYIWEVGKGKSSWSSMHVDTGQEGKIFTTGFVPYDFVDYEYLPWRGPPAFTNFANASKINCIAVEISELGARLYALSCDTNMLATCFKYNDTTFSPFTITDNRGLTPVMTVEKIKSEDRCGLECLSRSWCLSFTLHNSTELCHLYDSKNTAVTPDTSLELHRKIAACSQPFSPWHGTSVVDFGNTIGNQRQYKCDSLWMLPVNIYNNTYSCQANGRWSQIPMCATEYPRCPIGWEQYQTTCYYLSDNKLPGWSYLTWAEAEATCRAKDAYLLQIFNRDELNFVSKMLDVDCYANFWTGGNDQLIPSVFSWSTNEYAEIKYLPFPSLADGLQPEPYDGIESCLSLQSIFNDTDLSTSFLVEEACTYNQRFLCFKKLLPVGAYNCSQYGENSCAINSHCADEKCICDEDYFQIGVDGDMATTCEPIVPVGSSGCFIASHGHIDNLCPNSSVCVNAKCKCSSDTYQNGPDGSFSTVCINEKPTCPDTNWIFYDNRCYRVYPEEFRDYIMDNKPPIAADYCCGKYSAYLATIHTQEDNDFLMLLGLTRSRRWIGHHFQKAEARWVDNSTVDFLNFGYTNANLTSDYCTYMDEVGYWRQSDCFNFDVTDVTCERAARCKSLPVVVNGSYSSTFVADVGSTYIYSCVAGYILAESHSGAVTCLEVERESLWTPPPMCNSLLVDIYELYTGVTLYGLQLSTVGTASDGLCAVECYNHIDCSVFVYNPMIHECVTFSNKSESAETGLVSLPNHEIWIHKYDYCGPVPHVQHATYNVTGTGPGSKVKYQCQGHYRIDRMTSDTLTCNDQARWDQDKLPVCVSRFERVNGYFPAGYKNGKVVYRTYSIADCELACMEETQFHCVRCAYYSGVCYLFDVPQTGNRGDYNLLDTDDFVSNCVSSELIDADLEEFDLWYHQTVEIGDGDLMTYTDGQSAELCAQACIYNNCTFFTYHWLNLTCAVFGSAIPTTTEMPSDPNSHVYIRRYGCVAPPTVANARVDIILQQVPGTYSIGDQVQVECLVPGEERVNNHDGLMVCQKTEKWSTPPACRNLCPNGWYMKEYTCYKLYVSVPRTFWDAYKVCHTEDAGLVNLETVTELQSSVADVWNWTGAISDSFWLGAYTDLSEWKWSERLADDVLGVLPSLSDPIHSDRLGAAVQFPSGTVTEAPVTDLKPFICERAAAKLVCPPGWEKYQNQCLKVFNSVLMNYTDAITACETEGSTIASVPMVFKADVIGDLVTAAGESKAYVGLYKPINGMYKLEDGARILHKYLFTQESSLTSELCGTLQTNFDYLTSDCATELAYVCQKSLDEVGLPTDFSSLPCSTDNFCNDTNLVCSRWKDGSTFLPPRCVGIACPPPWVYINGRCYKYNRKFQTFSEAFLDCVEDDSEVFIPNNIKENYDVFFWLRSLNTQVKSSAVHIGIEKVMGPTHIAMDSRKTPSFTRTTSSSSNYVLGVYDKYQGTWAGIASDVSCTTVCEKGLNPTQPYDYQYEGCYTEVATDENRDLSERTLVDSAMTVDICATHCRDHGFKYCGLEAGVTCRCGNTRGRYGRLATTSCDAACPGDPAQICGGTNIIAVYRVTSNACVDSMPAHPTDPTICFSFVKNSLLYSGGISDCLLQGTYPNSKGKLLSMENPYVEEAAYHQLFRSILRPTAGNQTESVALSWIGLNQLGNRVDLQWESGLDVTWGLFDGADEQNFWQFAFITNISLGGLWKETFTFMEQHPYACQITDGSQKIFGEGIQHQHTSTGTVQTVREGEVETARMFDYGCLLDRTRCPNGFTIHMWVKVIDVASNHHILSTGDCMTDIIASKGFCLSYLAVNQSIVALDVRNNTCKRLEVRLPTGTIQTHLSLYFTNETDMYLYMNGDYKGQLNNHPDIDILGHVEAGEVYINYDDGANIELENVTFIASPPDQRMLELYRDTNSPSVNQNLTDVRKDFGLWGLDLTPWGSPGVDGDGLSLSRKAFTYELGQTTKEWLADPTVTFTLATWIKVPLELKEDIDIITFGGGYVTLFSLSYNATLNQVKFLVASADTSYSGVYSLALGEWQHISLTYDLGFFSVYLNGDFVGSLGKWTAATDPGGNYTVKVYAGSAMCPLGWRKNELSCYMIGQAPSNEYWPQDYYCQEFGGHLVAMDSGQELEFLAKYLEGSGSVYTGIFNQVQFPSPYRAWFDTRGNRRNDTYFSDPKPNTVYENFVSMYFDPFYNMSIPVQSGNTAQNLSALGNGTNVTEVDTSFSGVTACEINLSGKHSRQQMSMRCLDGWYFLYDRCYKLTTVAASALQAVLECNKDRAVLPQITTSAKQIYLSNWIRSIMTEATLYLGLQLRQPMAGNASYLWNDMRPLPFTYWGTKPVTGLGADCVVMNCTKSTTSCLWESVSCDSPYPTLCERPADTECGPGWKLYKDKCVSMVNVTNAEDGWATCTVAGTLPISLITKADMDEYIYTFELGSSTCLTTGILDIGGNYVINSPDMLTASHTCIGLDATGPIQQPCANFDCVICEHYVDGGVSIDNVHIKSELLDATAVKDLYLQEAYMRITYIWDMESSNATATVVEGSRIMDNQTLQYCMVELHTEASVAVTTDPTMGNVLQITDSLTGAFYNLSQSDACLQSISECKQGITVMFWIAGTNISNCVLVDTTANETGSTGVKIWVDESGRRLYASVLELNYVWKGWIWVVTQDWVHIAITWQSHIGLRFHINFRGVYTVTRREIQTVFSPTVVPSSSLYVGLCTDHVLLHLDNLEVYNYALESRELLQLQKTKDIEKMIDFNEAVSSSNMNLEKNISLTETVWRNSLFQTVVRVDNHLGQSPAMYSNQLPHCFTRADLCSGPFTTSLWLRPLYMEADQVFLTAGTSMDTDMTSLKIWYDSYTDDYILEVFYDKIHFTINFYMTLYKWSHLIINGNLGNSELYLYVNGQAAVTTTTTFVVDRMPPEYDVTFLRVGEVGTFEIDDIRHFPSIKQAKDIYELKSCHEYELAGFNGVQQLAMNFDPWDGAMGSPNATCDLQSYQTFQFRMDQNETSNSLYNITLEDTTTNSMVFTDGVLNEAILLNTSGLLVNITSEKCFGSIAHCYFGFTMAMWVRPQSDPLVPSTDPFVVMRMGGNLTRNESGISIECTDPTGLLYHSNSTLCSLVLVNHTRKWSTSFYLMYNSWSHLAITWNPYYTLNLYKNAHSVSDLGAVITSEIVSGYSFINQSESTLCIGCFLGSSDVVMAVDEVYLLDMDMSQKDIRKLYGVHHLCSKDWKYLSHTDMCYHFSTATATHPQGELTCQSFGGNLADEVDLQTHQLFVQIAVEDGLTGKYFLNYKQLPRKGAHALRVPDGSVRTFTTFNLPTTSTRKCGLLYKSTTWQWDDCDCSSIKTFMCQNNPWYAMAEPLYLNHSSISQTPDLAHQWTGNVGYKRGVTSYTMALNDTQLHQVASDRCLVDHRFCHNGLTISFWLQVCNNSAGDNQMILTTMDSPTVYGLAVYWNRSAGLVVDMRTQDNFTRTVTPISECHWNNIAISINNETNVQMFINGKEVAADLNYNETDTAALVLGHEVQVSIGTQADGSQGLVAMLDNITVVEHKVLDDVHLHQTVYDNFPDFHLTFDNHSLILPSSGVSSTSGWHGDCLTFDGTNSTQFEGHLYQDCLVAPDFCWEGFTLSLWLYPTTDAGSQGIMSARSDYRGLAMAYYVSYQGLPNHHWLIIQENNVAHNVPFILSNHVWSHIILTWYSNGSTVLYVNGIEQGQTASTTAVTTGNPPQPTTFTLGAISGYNDISSGIFQGAIDEYWFRPRPLESNTMLDLYKNSTYVRTKFVNRFEDSPPPEYGKATLVQAVYGTGSSLVSGQDWLNLTQTLVNQPNCVLDIDHCIHGFTLSLYLQMIQENDTDQVILTTGAHNSQGLGIALLYTAMNKSLPFRRYLEVTILTTNSEYRTWFNMQWWTWNLVTITFHPMFGVKVYVDDILTSMSDAGAPRAIAPTIFTQDLLIGDVPFGNLWLGQFAVDDLQILDRAMFEGDLWMQHVHSHLQVDGVMVWDDVTRDECHHLCDNTTCSVFAFCDDRAFGSCVVYSDNVTSNFSSDAVHSHASCDLFTKMNTLHQVQLYGCFPASVINDMLLLPGPADITSCIDACIDNITKTRYAAFNSQCYCGLETIPIAITAADYNTNQSCTIHEVLVYQLSGLREFLNVTVPITSLDVMLDPGAVVMVDQDLYVTLVAMTELAYAGFSISAGDGRDTYYTGRNYTTLVYPTMGLYILHIEALNEFSWMTDSIPIYVMTSLEGVEIYSENITATDTALAVTLNVIGGNYVTCTLIYGDGFQDSVYHENTSVPFLFSHVYTQENINMINVTCANNVSQTQTWKTVVSLHAVENLTLTAPQCCPLGDNINITWFADRGSNVSLNLYHSDQLVFEGEQLTLADPTSLLVNSSIYHVTGIHTFNLTVTNIVSALVQQATNVNIATEIGSLNINISNQFVRVDESFSCALSISNMSIADVIIDFDDGTTDSHFSLNHTMLYEYLVKHKFSSAGSFLINANATNCYNSVNDSTTLVVEHPVDVLTAAVITVADPFDLLKVNLTLVNASTPHPTSAVCDINFGDGGTETLNPLVFVNGYIELSHNYSVNGIFTISVFCHNNISSFTHIESVKVGSDIVGLSINTLSHIPQGSVSSISINIDSGSLVLYSIDFGDGSPHYSTTTPVTYTNGQINVTHHFSQIAVYTLTVTANNTFGTVINNTVTVSIMEEVTGLIFYGSRISKVGWPVDFYIRFLSPGTDTCIHFSPGDGTEYVYGGANCPLKTEYSGYIYIDSTDNPLEITHAYILPNTYHITVQAENEVSVENDQMSVVILEFPCTFPKVTIMGFSSNISRPSYSYPSVALTVRALADTYCMPIHKVIFEWNIMSHSGSSFNRASINMESLPYLYIPALSLGYGLYVINVTVYIEGFPFFNDTSIVYLYEDPTPMVLELIGGEERTVPVGSTVLLDASHSVELDFPIHQTLFEIHWFSWTSPDEFDPVIHEASAYLTTLDVTFPSLPAGAGDNTTTVTLPGADLGQVMTRTIVAKMSLGTRVKWKVQDILVTDTSVSMLSIKCVENCYSIISADLPVRVKGECLTCTEYNRLQLTYLWKLYKVAGIQKTLIQNLDTWTYTGINSANLAIKPGLLEPGEMYEVRLESGDDYCSRTFRVTWSPYNGQCLTNINLGLAFKSKFIVSCTDWLDEGDNAVRDYTIDRQYTRNYEFTFYLMVNTSTEYKRTPFFRVLGSWATAPEMMLGEGDPNLDNQVELVVTIKDFYGSVTTITNSVKVMPPVYTSLETTNCTEMELYEAEKDMMGILMLANGITNRLKQDISRNGENQGYDVQVMTATIDKLADNVHLIQDEVLAANTIDTLNNMITMDSTMDNLQPDNKMKIGELYQNMAGSLQQRFKSSMSSDEKQKLATDLLSGVVTYAQNTKYSTDCLSGCDAKLKQGEFVVEFIQITHNISSMLLEDTVPGEEERIVNIPQYKTTLCVKRQEALEVLSSTLTLQGEPVFDVPDLSGIINILENNYIDVEMMVADNLYTTDASSEKIKAQTAGLTLHVDGQILHVTDLVSAIRVRSQPHVLQELTFTSANLSASSDTNLFYIQLTVNETDVTPLFVLRSRDENVTLRYYVKVGTPPLQTEFDLNGVITSQDLQDVSGNGTLWQTIIQLSHPTIASSLVSDPPNMLYLGLRTENQDKNTAIQIALYVLDCLFWDDGGKQWSRKGLTLGNVTTYTETSCHTSHLTSFGTNVFVPPNTIDFKTVWSKFSADNVAVIATVGGLIVLYFLVLFWVRRADQRDVAQWAIYPLCDNLSTDRYHYQMTVYTGLRQNSGTTSKVFFVLGGEDGDTEVRAVEDSKSRPLTRGSVNNYLLSVPFNLGNLNFLRIWHDNTGKGTDADWYLNMVLIKDLQNNQKYMFLCNQWMAVDKGDQEVERLLPVATQDELKNFDHLFYTRTRQDLTDGHLWISVLSRPTQSVFTRVQRLSCCLSLLFLTMVTNAMWYGTMDNQQQQNVHLGPFTFSGQELITSIAGSLIVVPVSIIIITFFKKAERRASKDLVKVEAEPEEEKPSRLDKMLPKKGLEQYCSDECCDERAGCVSPSAIDTALVQPFSMYRSWADFENRTSRLINSRKNQQMLKESDAGKKKKQKPWPFWCLYVAWALVILSVLASGFFVILYSIEWGTDKSSRWLTAFFLSFIESVILIQPLKVVTVALVLILVFRRVDDDDEEAYVNKIVLPEVMATERQSIPYPTHRKPYKEKASDFTNLENAREYRKRMNRLFNIGRELGAYIVYLVIVCILTYENRSKNAYPTYSHLENTFLKPASKYHASYINISSAEYFWNWAHDVLIPGLYSEGMYSGNDSTDYHGYLSDNIHYRVGTPRLRQARVTKADCRIPSGFRKFFKDCYPDYGLDSYDSESYGVGWTTQSANNSGESWQYQDSLKLNGYPVVAKYDSYGGGGYVASLGNTNQTATDMFDYLHDSGWIDRNTRAVLVEANIYNPNVNLFSVICFVLEFPASGSIIPFSQISPVALYRYNGASALFLLILDFVFVAFTLYYLFILVKKIKQEKCEFFKQFWNVIDFLNMAFSITACVFYGMHFIMVELATSDFHRNKDAFLNLQYIVLWDALFGYMLAFLLFCSMLKLLLILRFNPKITQLSGTLQKAKGPISNFMVVFVLTFLAFAQFGYLVFGRVDQGYYTFITTLETLMSMLMMKMEIDNMMLTNGLLGSLFVFLFVLFIVFILINMLLSVINDAFTEVRKDPSFLPDDPAMASFLLNQIKAFILGYSNDSTKKGTEKTKEKNLEGKIDDLDLRLRAYLQALHRDPD